MTDDNLSCFHNLTCTVSIAAGTTTSEEDHTSNWPWLL